MKLITRIHRIRRAIALLAGLAGAWLAAAIAAPAAFAMQVPPGGGSGGVSPLTGGKHPPLTAGAAGQVRTVIVGGMPGWQIALIAIGAALVAATAAVLAYRARAARHPAIPAA